MLLQVSRACEDNHDEEEQLAAARQQSDEYFANAFGYTFKPWGSAYYQPSVPGNSKRNLKAERINYCYLFDTTTLFFLM